MKKLYFAFLLLCFSARGVDIAKLVTYGWLGGAASIGTLCCMLQAGLTVKQYSRTNTNYAACYNSHVQRTNAATTNNFTNNPNHYLNSCSMLSDYTSELKTINLFRQFTRLGYLTSASVAIGFFGKSYYDGSAGALKTIILSTLLSVGCYYCLLTNDCALRRFQNPCNQACIFQTKPNNA